jgi:hypothetical protein
MNIDKEIEGEVGQESMLSITTSQDTIDVVMTSDILTINGVRFLKEDFCVKLVVKFHKERTVWGRIKNFVSRFL